MPALWNYWTYLPAFSCNKCLKGIVSCSSTDPARFDAVVKIINCSAHKTTTARPPPPSQTRPPSTSTAASSTVTSNGSPTTTTSSTAPPPYTSTQADNNSSTSTAPPPYTSAPSVPPKPASAPQQNPPTLQRRGIRTRGLLPLQVYTVLYSYPYHTIHQTSCGLNVTRGFWRNVKPVAEALLVDPTRFKKTLRIHGSAINLKRSKTETAAILNTASGQQKLRILNLDGITLVPLARY